MLQHQSHYFIDTPYKTQQAKKFFLRSRYFVWDHSWNDKCCQG